MNDQLTSIYANNIPESLKRRAKSTAAAHGIDFQDFIRIAIEHYLEYVEGGEYWNGEKKEVESIIEKEN